MANTKFVGVAKLRLEDLLSRPGISMDGFQAEFSVIDGAVNKLTDIGTDMEGDVYIIPIYKVTASAGTLSVDSDKGSGDITTGDGVLVIGRKAQEYL